MIVGVAIQAKDGTLYALMRPARHCHFSATYNEEGRKAGWDFPWKGWDSSILSLSKGKQGFITSEGKFLGREDAAKFAFEMGQISEPKTCLFSEDLW